MASTYSTSLKLELIGQGEQSGTWGLTTNNNLGTLVEQAITGVQTISMSNATYTLSSYDGAIDEARNAVLVMTGTNLAPQNLVAPSVEKVYIVKNLTGNTINIKTSTGNAIAISNSTVAQVYCDGTDFYSAAPTINSLTGNFAATGTITSGGAMTSGGTLTAPTLSITGTGSTGSNFSVGGTTYTGALVCSGASSSGASTVTGNQTVTGTATSGAMVTSSIYDYGSATINGNLVVGGSITAGSIAGVTGIVKQIVSVLSPVYPTTTSSSPIPTGHYANIYPTAASSKILVLWYGAVSQPQYLGPETYALASMFRNGVQSYATAGISVGAVPNAGGGVYIAVTTSGQGFSYVDNAGTTGLIQYQMYFNALGGGQCNYNDLAGATITLIEISQP